MTLTKGDIVLIKEIVRESVDEYGNASIMPILERILDQMATKEDLKGMATKEDLKGMATKEDLKELERKLRAEANENYLSLKEQIDESISLIGIYFNKCATKEDLKTIDNRVTRLEVLADLTS